MNLPRGFEAMRPVRRALEVARHELVTLHRLVVVDGVAPNETFEIDTNGAIELIDEALNALGDNDNRPS